MGTKTVSTQFTRMGESVLDASPALETIADLMMSIEEQVFNSQGRRGGGSWKQDTAEWLLRKQRMGLDPRINHATGELRDSVTVPDAYGQIKRIGRQSLWFGSDLPQAEPSQRNRPFIKFTVYDRQKMASILKDWLMVAWRSGREA